VPRFSAAELRTLGVSILKRLGAPTDYAELVVDVLIEANLVGHDSHGIQYITRYAERIKRGVIDPSTKPEVTRETASTAIVDGHWTFGQVTAKRTMELAIEKARKTSVSAVGAIHCNHIGRLGAYTMMAADKGMVGMLMANVVHPVVQPSAAPPASSEPIQFRSLRQRVRGNHSCWTSPRQPLRKGRWGWRRCEGRRSPWGGL